eukprot:14352412-Alexandrium_andersonii.AAC.1
MPTPLVGQDHKCERHNCNGATNCMKPQGTTSCSSMQFTAQPLQVCCRLTGPPPTSASSARRKRLFGGDPPETT